MSDDDEDPYVEVGFWSKRRRGSEGSTLAFEPTVLDANAEWLADVTFDKYGAMVYGKTPREAETRAMFALWAMLARIKNE